MEIYVHSRADERLVLVEADPAWTADEFLNQHGPGEGAEVWLEDSEQPLEHSATLAEAGISDRAHLHISTCRRVSVSVRYGGGSESSDFPPGAAVASVFAWAAGPKGFKLTPTERAKHTLALCDGNTELDRSEHVGSFADEACSVCLDLAPKERFEG